MTSPLEFEAPISRLDRDPPDIKKINDNIREERGQTSLGCGTITQKSKLTMAESSVADHPNQIFLRYRQDQTSPTSLRKQNKQRDCDQPELLQQSSEPLEYDRLLAVLPVGSTWSSGGALQYCGVGPVRSMSGVPVGTSGACGLIPPKGGINELAALDAPSAATFDQSPTPQERSAPRKSGISCSEAFSVAALILVRLLLVDI